MFKAIHGISPMHACIIMNFDGYDWAQVTCILMDASLLFAQRSAEIFVCLSGNRWNDRHEKMSTSTESDYKM